jgi:ribosome-associated protein
MPYGNKRLGLPALSRSARSKRPPASATVADFRARGQRQQENSRRIATLAARAGLDKKAEAVEIIDVIGKVDYADYLVLMTGRSDRNVIAIADAVEGVLASQGVRAIASEGLPLASWVLIDFVDVVVHVFQEDARSIYDLDGLWMDARRVPAAEFEQEQPVSPRVS